MRFLNDLLLEPNFGLLLPTDRHVETLTQTLSELTELRGNVMHDVHTAVLMRENGVREIRTRDADFCRFQFSTDHRYSRARNPTSAVVPNAFTD